jgi:hypothetical protein
VNFSKRVVARMERRKATPLDLCNFDHVSALQGPKVEQWTTGAIHRKSSAPFHFIPNRTRTP